MYTCRMVEWLGSWLNTVDRYIKYRKDKDRGIDRSRPLEKCAPKIKRKCK